MEQVQMKDKALQDIVVLDFSQLLAGPYAAMMLGDMGAEVIKIERHIRGDIYRNMTFGNVYLNGSEAPTFLAWNRNKKSLAIDLKCEEAKEVIYKMVKSADIIIHNFRPGVMERLGYGYEDLKKINPRIIYGCNSGFGPTGPYAKRPGQDLLAQGLSGIMSLTGRRNSPPTPLGTGIADHLAAYHLVYGIISALYYREKFGIGQKVEVDLFRSMLSFMNQEYLTVMNSDVEVNKPDSGIGLPFLDAPYGVYRCLDGYITIAMNDFTKLIKVIGDESLLQYNNKDALFEHRDEIFHAIEAVTETKTQEYWLKAMLNEDLWVAKVNLIRDVEKDPQVIHMEVVKKYEHKLAGKVKTIGPVVTMSETPPVISMPPPLLGEHSIEILKRFGIDEKKIEYMITKGIVTSEIMY